MGNYSFSEHTYAILPPNVLESLQRFAIVDTSAMIPQAELATIDSTVQRIPFSSLQSILEWAIINNNNNLYDARHTIPKCEK